ncbi:hypothetical protein [Leptospira alstonii]|uniref:hypothetical protein n=1 Tax=Leptospira alstonii TaxID=28452 RepID=UPI000773E7A8|nr:hypothetical protein [Leptospira alstonii]
MGSFISKADVAGIFRGTKNIDGDGYKYYKFKELPKQCERSFVPKNIEDISIEPAPYLSGTG